jgi:uncharacterized protein
MIKPILRLALAGCFLTSVCCAADAPASEASIKQLLEVSHAHQLLDSMMGQVDGMMKNAMAQATQGQKVDPATRQEIDKFEADMMTEMKGVLDWNKLEPMYVRIYQKSFSQQEIDGLVGFYKTPAGQALINKMPAVFQNTMAELQQMMQPMMQHLQQKQQEIAAKVQAKNKGS